MEESKIKEKVIQIISQRSGIDRQIIWEHGDKCSLFDSSIGLLPRDLLTLFFELQTEFNITFTEADIIERRFDDINQIVSEVAEKISTYKAGDTDAKSGGY